MFHHLRHVFITGTIRGQFNLNEVRKASLVEPEFWPLTIDLSTKLPELKPAIISYVRTDMIPDYERIGQNSMTRSLVKAFALEKSPWLDNEYEIIDEIELKEWLIYLIDELGARPNVLESSVIHAGCFSWDFMKTFIDRNECLSPEHFQFYMSHASVNRHEKFRFSEHFHTNATRMQK